jgi:hypothetical protein
MAWADLDSAASALESVDAAVFEVRTGNKPPLEHSVVALRTARPDLAIVASGTDLSQQRWMSLLAAGVDVVFGKDELAGGLVAALRRIVNCRRSALAG